MDLKDFVKETLTQITDGIKESAAAVRKSGGIVNPANYSDTGRESHFATLDNGAPVFLVDFDVAVTATEGAKSGAKAGLAVASLINVGAGGETERQAATTNRITFKIPLALPVDQQSETELRNRVANLQRTAEGSDDGL